MTLVSTSLPSLQTMIDALMTGHCHDPFSLLGRHREGRLDIVRVFYPDALEVRLIGTNARGGAVDRPMKQIDPRGLYAAPIARSSRYRLRVRWADGWQETYDPYSFGLLLEGMDLYLFSEGRHQQLDRMMGAIPMEINGIAGVRFAVWAPNALRVSVIGDFNIWDGRRHPMRLRHDAGVWELFVPGLKAGERYKYEIMAQDGSVLPAKADPYARATELPPATASVVAPLEDFAWHDDEWMTTRRARQASDAPISIYEAHAPSWRHPVTGRGVMDWDELGDTMIPYMTDLGFTHLELLPITEYPFFGSWGYQPLSLYAPTARHGGPEQFARFVDRCHQSGIGVIMDWVPAHFPADLHGLALFDGTHLYEHADPREGYHQDWHTLIYNYGRNEVRGFLTGSALHWIKRFHIDGLRVDAVASMLYRDYSRRDGEWYPNIHGGRENLEAISFLRHLCTVIQNLHPDTMLIAEESTAWPGVTAPARDGGLGFQYKWNMGWMHDTLRYMQRDPLWRGYHGEDITFGMVYAYSEHFILPLSHDEVVHGKGSLLDRMPGDDWQKHAGLRTCYALMWAYPGRKLLFMGCELAQPTEWDFEGELSWYRLLDEYGRGVQATVRALNGLYRSHPALHRQDDQPAGFRWIIADDTQNAVFVWLRQATDSAPVLVVCNMTPVVRTDYRIGVPDNGAWHELLNTDAACFGGSNVGNGGVLQTHDIPAHGMDQSLLLTLPPLGVLYLSPKP
ncbi:1,4-alpha-glucan branching protein GlgB [Gluconobacter morbifer]|uniref:1,4-alpha-glucan branching enzyme GlgB n=1 Tax=Gluconobacter morbifer G707 TaxID=1088869 RepID=G6XF09_9PROT|nr:1,4-alpha-glucan branching protein GlgB [Gluconobacter morbifer]EHH68767.1 glycogen branching enzyme [Gluconobacter morbifer G707]